MAEWGSHLDLDRCCTESADTLGSVNILTILNLPIHDHGVLFYQFMSSSISFNNVLLFSVNNLLLSWLIPKCFILFDDILNGIIFIICFFRLLSG